MFKKKKKISVQTSVLAPFQIKYPSIPTCLKTHITWLFTYTGHGRKRKQTANSIQKISILGMIFYFYFSLLFTKWSGMEMWLLFTPSIHPSIHRWPCVATESSGLTLFSLYTFPLKIIQFIQLFNYSDCWYRDPLAALENNADKNALNLSAKGNTIRIIDGCKMQKEKKQKTMWARESVGGHWVMWCDFFIVKWDGQKKPKKQKKEKTWEWRNELLNNPKTIQQWVCWSFSINISSAQDDSKYLKDGKLGCTNI